MYRNGLKHNKKGIHERGFTIIEMILTVGIVAVLYSIILIGTQSYLRHSAQARNAKRQSDINSISFAIYQYSIDNKKIPSTITDHPKEICKSYSEHCYGLVDLSVLTDNEKYLVTIPSDDYVLDPNSTGYSVFVNKFNRITLKANYAEIGETLEITR